MTSVGKKWPFVPLENNMILKLYSRMWIRKQSIKFDQDSICRVSKLDSIELDSILKLLTRGLPLLVCYSTWSPTLSALYSSQDDRVFVITWIHKYHTTINIKHAHSFQGIIFLFGKVFICSLVFIKLYGEGIKLNSQRTFYSEVNDNFGFPLN